MDRPEDPPADKNGKKRMAMQVIDLLGIVSLFGDITYEGGRSVTGPYLAILGANAAVVGFIAGLGEFIGYALRLASGYLADKTERYWLMTFLGYGLLVSIPLLAFAGYWEIAAILLISERMGKAIRAPSRDAILSHATKQVGRGWGFAIHEALDQVGAIVGPLLFTAVFILNGGYREAFSLLWVPVILTIAILFVAKRKVPAPERLEASERVPVAGEEKGRLPKAFWLYTIFILVSVIGFANFQLISFHLKAQSVVPDVELPIFYAIAMGVDGLVALAIGKIYDKKGMISIVLIPLLTIPIPFLAFTNEYGLALVGVVIWGAVMGIQETTMRAAVADMTPLGRRGIAYGIFNTAYGASWLIGGVLMGLIYDISIGYIAILVVLTQAIAMPVFLMVRREVGFDGKVKGQREAH